MTSGIYKISVLRPGKAELIYIGQATDISRRESDHFRCLRGRRHDNVRLQSLFDKYGDCCFRMENVLLCRPSELVLFEQIVLDFFLSSMGRNVLNIRRMCVTSSLGMKASDDTRAKMSAAKKGRPGRVWSDESRVKISASKKGITPSRATIVAAVISRTGTRHSPETRAKMSASQKGREISLETRLKISASRIALLKTPEGRTRLSQSLKGNKNSLGHRHSLETRKKQSMVALNREAAKRQVA